jgi:transcriptional regulator with XRE-family HTH domain
MITGEQVKAARALLDLSQRDLALRVGMPQTLISEFERSGRPPIEARLRIIRHVLETAGVEFPKGEPPRLKSAPK